MTGNSPGKVRGKRYIGRPSIPPLTLKAVAEDQTIYADGINEHFRCAFSPTRPLDPALVVPLRLDKEVIGTIKLYEP